MMKGIWRLNPTFRIVLGMCPTLAVTTAAINGVAMGLAVTFVLVFSNVMIAALRTIIPKNVRIPVFIVIIASFVTIVDLLMAAYFLELHETLGLFIPLIVVNCIILGRAEAFASRNPVVQSLADGLGMGIGFTLSLMILGGIREILGNGTLFSVPVLNRSFQPSLIMIMPPGAFITLGMLMALMNRIEERD
ncbi:MAG: electron transport complex subunit RsxE [bacterium]